MNSITREQFSEAVENIFGVRLEKFLDVIELSKNNNDWIIQYYNETVLLYDTNSDLFVSWYKLTHIGRAIVSNIDSVETLYVFLNQFMDDFELKEEKENE